MSDSELDLCPSSMHVISPSSDKQITHEIKQRTSSALSLCVCILY